MDPEILISRNPIEGGLKMNSADEKAKGLLDSGYVRQALEHSNSIDSESVDILIQWCYDGIRKKGRF